MMPAFSPVGPMTSGNVCDGRYQRYNYDLCKSIDITKLGIVLEKMVYDGWMDPQIAKIYMAQAEALLAALRSENGRCHGRAKVSERND